MARIIAGRFEQRPDADRAVDALRQRGFGSDQVDVFYLNPPGQHAKFPVGGDENMSPGANRASGSAAKGALVGGAARLALGLAAAPVAGAAAPVAGASVGAYTGSLVGALKGMKQPVDPGEAGRQPSTDSEIDPSGRPPRPAGVMVTVNAPDEDRRSIAIDVLRCAGARDIEHANGEWRDGKRIDFDPLKAPDLVGSGN
jgi:hypothetical protein